jgi:hypothetical protein
MRMRYAAITFVLVGLLSPLSASGQGAARPPVVVSLTVNHEVEVDVRQGTPMVVTVDLMHAALYSGDLEPVTVAAVGGSWAGAIELSGVDGDGDPVAWGFTIAHTPTGPLTLDAETVGRLGWWMEPAATAGIPPGTYELTATLDPSSVQAPFAGLAAARSVPVRIEVTPAGGAQTPAESAAEALLRADYHVLRGEDGAALAEVDGLLGEQPLHVGALGYRGHLLRQAGQPAEALADLATALDALFAATPDPEEPPTWLLNAYLEVLGELESSSEFDVTAGAKSPVHPAYGVGSDQGFSINGVEGGELWLHEDTTYTFRMRDVPAESPFYFSTSEVGSGQGVYLDGVVGHPASGTAEMTLTPGASTPDLLWYQSLNQPSMGWRIHILRGESGVGVDPPPVSLPVEYHLTQAYPNPFNEETRFTLTIGRPQRVRIDVYDLEGRLVRSLFDNFLTARAPTEFVLRGTGLVAGIYFIQLEGETFRASRGVLLVR